MNIVTAIIGFALLSMFALPFIIASRNKRKGEGKMLELLQANAAGQGQSIGEHDLDARFGIGLSDNKQVIYFIDGHNDSPSVHRFVLQDLKQCKMNVVKNTVGDGQRKEWVIAKIELVLTGKTPQAAEQRFGLYDVNNLVQLDNELQLATKWEAQLNSLIH